jgi:hypothetical protein
VFSTAVAVTRTGGSLSGEGGTGVTVRVLILFFVRFGFLSVCTGTAYRIRIAWHPLSTASISASHFSLAGSHSDLVDILLRHPSGPRVDFDTTPGPGSAFVYLFVFKFHAWQCVRVAPALPGRKPYQVCLHGDCSINSRSLVPRRCTSRPDTAHPALVAGAFREVILLYL